MQIGLLQVETAIADLHGVKHLMISYICIQIHFKDYLCNITIPKEAMLCNNKMCKVHHKDICDYHDAIILCMINACKESIPTPKHVNNIKTVPGWNDYVQHYLNASLFWHNMWVDNGIPHVGVVADLRCKTRAKYHHVCKMVLKMDEDVRCDKMVEAIKKMITKHFHHKKASYATKVDDAESKEDICDLFMEMFFNLYNPVSYHNADMEVLKKDIDDMINTQCTYGNHSIISSDVIISH